MNDYSLRTLVDAQDGVSPQVSTPLVDRSQETDDFRELLAAMLVGFAKPSSSEAGFSFDSLIAPIMFNLLEQLMAQQINSGVTAEVTAGVMAQPIPQGLPLEGRLTQGSHPGHVALDFSAVVGTPVKSTMDGKVVYAGWNDQGYGNLVIIENGPYRTYYAHLSEMPVTVGQNVRAGAVIGLSGNTGNSTGPHLHYEVRLNGQQIDPTPFTLP